jgi:hypothetical protein
VSLYGTGRAEGIATVASIAGLAMLVHVLGALQTQGPLGPDLLGALRAAVVPALGGTLCYRWLRAMGRSRFAGFLAGTAYTMSPWLCAVATVPREQLAAALAPLALEAAHRCGHPAHRRTWLPWTGLCLAAPFLAGPTVVALLATLLVAAQLRLAVAGCDFDDRRPLVRNLCAGAVLGAVAAGSLVWLDPLGAVFGLAAMPRAAEILTAHREVGAGIDLPALMRLAGPVLLMFAGLGVLRRQRHASIQYWLLILAAGALPALAARWLPPSTAGLLGLLPVTAWWISLLAVTVLGAAGLDDFLELPLRRRTALPWLLAIAVAGAPLIPLASTAPEQEWPLTATILLLALLLPTWRRVGILRFKNVLATATLLALAVPALQVLPTESPAAWPAAPGGAAMDAGLQPAPGHPAWHYAGLLLVFATCSVAAAWSAFRRSQNASRTPPSAKAAIKKKARPSQRS